MSSPASMGQDYCNRHTEIKILLQALDTTIQPIRPMIAWNTENGMHHSLIGNTCCWVGVKAECVRVCEKRTRLEHSASRSHNPHKKAQHLNGVTSLRCTDFVSAINHQCQWQKSATTSNRGSTLGGHKLIIWHWFGPFLAHLSPEYHYRLLPYRISFFSESFSFFNAKRDTLTGSPCSLYLSHWAFYQWSVAKYNRAGGARCAQ